MNELDKIDVVVATTEEGKRVLLIGNERIEIQDYKIQSSTSEEAELCITIKGSPSLFNLSANLIK